MEKEGREHPDTWAGETVSTAAWGDLRRTERLVTMASAIAEDPSASLLESLRTWAETLAVSRFLDTEAATPQQILRPHGTTREEIMRHARILPPADPTESNRSSQEAAEGLGSMGLGKKAQGFFVRTVVAMDAESQHV